jgi:hypothetical protein
MTNAKTETSGFIIIDKDTGKEIATLPLTIPIGATVEGYKKAGYNVSWSWKEDKAQ